ncbi:MAG: flavin reductase family protein, partial [Atopobiaceae bacterium]|nr:flavin reductase family protein [Atopobiaceae bacterium]
MAFREIDIRGLSLNPFTRFGDDWALVTAGDESGLNTMTVSWGQMGTLWGRDVVTVYIRPSRHTKAFVDAAERFTVSFY